MKTTPFVNTLGSSNWKLVEGKNDNFPVLFWEDGTATTRTQYAEATNISATGYDVHLYFTGANVDLIVFPTWTTKNGQDDLIWHVGEIVGNGIFHYRVNTSDHNNETGEYITHIYYNPGSIGICGLTINVPT